MNPLLGESPSLRADVVGVSLGQPMFQVTGQVRQAKVDVFPSETLPPITVVVHPAPITVDVPLPVLTSILQELTALRIDMERRSFGGRWKRFVAWVQGFWRN